MTRDSLPGDGRTGDDQAIPGDYQHRALTSGSRVQRFWHRTKIDLLEWAFPIHPQERILDIGCGSGVFSDRLAAKGADVLGLDANPLAIDYAQRTFGRPGCAFQEGLLDELDLSSESFDAACCIEVVEHVDAAQGRKMLGDLHRILRPGGRLLVTTPNYRGLWPLVEWAADRFASTAQMDGHQHITRFHRRLFRQFLEQSGYRVQRLRTFCTFAPFAAALSWRGACSLDRLERRLDLPFGNLLLATAIRP